MIIFQWDTPGTLKYYQDLIKNHYKGTDAVIIVYDITNRESFTNISKWLKEIQENTNENVKKFLVGNKIDIFALRTIEYDEAKKLADQFNMKFFETSAKD